MNPQKIFITGATGLLGRAVLKFMDLDYNEVTVGSRIKYTQSDRVHWQQYNLYSENPTLNLKGYDCVIHLASNTKGYDQQLELAGLQNLIAASLESNVQHFIFISIVGVDTIPLKLFRGKKKMERIIAGSGLPYTILRSTQFHEFFDSELIRYTSHRINCVPNISYQPIDVETVAAKIEYLSRNSPQNGIEEIGGRHILQLRAALEDYRKGIPIRKKSLVLFVPSFLLGRLSKALTTNSRTFLGKSWKDYISHRKMLFYDKS